MMMSEYVGRLPFSKIEELRKDFGGELGWHKLSKAKKIRLAELVFGVPVIKKSVSIITEKNVATGYHIPAVLAESK